MPNYSIQSSFAIKLGTTEAVEWALELAEMLQKLCNEEEIEGTAWDADVVLAAAEFDSDNLAAFSFPAVKEEGETAIWIHDDESFSPDLAATYVKILVDRFKLLPVSFEYACTCSKPRLNSFYGGAYFISQDGIQNTDTSAWVDRQLQAHEKQQQMRS